MPTTPHPHTDKRLTRYNRKRDFSRTPEPAGDARDAISTQRGYAVQKHAARRLHFDLRLELDGTLKSWAITREPHAVPGEKRLAVETEDHPLAYIHFAGDIPEGNYGAGHVELWDQGSWEPIGDPHKGLKKGHLQFIIHGRRLSGAWDLVRMKPRPNERQPQWLFIKRHDHSDGAGTKAPAKAVPLPPAAQFMPPQLASLAEHAPVTAGWLHEIKFDGYRCLAMIEKGKVSCFTRNGLDWTEKFRHIVPALKSLPVSSAVLDGEVIAADETGRPGFTALQKALSSGGPLLYCIFDLLWCDGQDLRGTPLLARKRRLAEVLKDAPDALRFSEHLEGSGEDVRQALCREGFEGVVSKRADGPYRSGRGSDWIKAKCRHEQEFVIGGWTPPSTKRGGFSSLLVGLREGDRLVYAGRVGTGFDDALLASLSKELKARAIDRCPFVSVPPSIRTGAQWVKPELVAGLWPLRNSPAAASSGRARFWVCAPTSPPRMSCGKPRAMRHPD